MYMYMEASGKKYAIPGGYQRPLGRCEVSQDSYQRVEMLVWDPTVKTPNIRWEFLAKVAKPRFLNRAANFKVSCAIRAGSAIGSNSPVPLGLSYEALFD